MNIRDTAHGIDLPTTHVAEETWSAARRRVRRRRTSQAAATASALAVALIAAGFAVAGDHRDQVATVRDPPSVTDSPLAPEPQPAVCPADTGSRAREADGPLSRGAVGAVLCSTGGGWESPPETLVTGLDELVDLINARPLARPVEPIDFSCMSDHPLDSYTIVLTYADNARRTARGQICDDAVTIGPTTRLAGAVDVVHEYLEVLARQRLTAVPPTDPADLSCPDAYDTPLSSAVPTREDLQLVAAIECTYTMVLKNDRIYGWEFTSSRELADSLVTRINLGFRAGARSYSGLDGRSTSPRRLILATTTWGDTIPLDLVRGKLARNVTPFSPQGSALGWLLDTNTLDLLTSG